MRIGCDLVYVPKFSQSLTKEAFLARLFHTEEVNECKAKAHPESSFAARFAAKEAFAKALGTGIYNDGVSPRSVWIVCQENGRPQLFLDDLVREKVTALGLSRWEVSLSHHGEYAMATVLLY